MASSPREEFVLEALRKALPEHEYAAIFAWSRTFYPFQREWLFDQSRFALCNKARQIGLSHTTAAIMVLWAAFFGETSTIISKGERESLEVLVAAEKHAKALTLLGSSWARCHRKGEELVFDNGGRIIALPASSGGRSFSGNVCLDEFAYAQNPAALWDGAAAVAMHGYRIRVVSTPNGVGNDFHSLATDPEKNRGWSLHEFKLARAEADGMRVNHDDLWKMAKGDPRLFSQLFECSFLDGQEQYIPTANIDAATLDSTELAIEAPCFAGYDVGLVNDLGALVILQQTQDRRVWVRQVITCKRTDWEKQQQIILQAFAEWRIQRLCIDATGIGTVPAEMLQKLLGKHRVEPVMFTLQSKEVLATGLYQAFADRMIQVPRDEMLKRDICSLRRIVTAAGNIRYDAHRSDAGHADRAWALALAIHACSLKPASRMESGQGDYSNS